MLPLWTILLWWRPAISRCLVLLVFRRLLLMRLSEHQISALCQAWTYSQILWWNSKENKGSPYRNFVGLTQKWKSDSPLNSKPIDIHRMLFLVLKKEIREGFAGIKLRLTLHQIRTLTYLFVSLTIRRKKRNKTLIVCSVLVVNLKTTMEKSG